MAAKFMKTKRIMVPLVTIALALSTIVAIPTVSSADMASLLHDNVMVAVEMQEYNASGSNEFSIVNTADSVKEIIENKVATNESLNNYIQEHDYTLLAEKRVHSPELAKKIMAINKNSSKQDFADIIKDIIKA